MSTEEELGYQDAMRQVQRALHRRLKALEEELSDATEQAESVELKHRMKEIHHLIEVVNSLHR